MYIHLSRFLKTSTALYVSVLRLFVCCISCPELHWDNLAPQCKRTQFGTKDKLSWCRMVLGAKLSFCRYLFQKVNSIVFSLSEINAQEEDSSCFLPDICNQFAGISCGLKAKTPKRLMWKMFKVDSSLKHVGQNVGHQRYLEENYGKRVRVRNLLKWEKWRKSSFLQVSVFKDNPVRQGIDRVSFFVIMRR